MEFLSRLGLGNPNEHNLVVKTSVAFIKKIFRLYADLFANSNFCFFLGKFTCVQKENINNIIS